MDIPFIKLSPTRNVTVLVDAPVPRSEQPQLAAKLLDSASVGGEQAGFLEKAALPGARLRLQMMGGEFCGNASMAVGAYLARQDNLPDGERKSYRIEVSGAGSLVDVDVVRTADSFRGRVCMPLPRSCGEVTLDADDGPRTLPMIDMGGIVHLIAGKESGLGREEIERRIRLWNETIRADALGVLMYDEAESAIEPIVYVPSTDTAVWECGCGSGTAALGCLQAVRTGKSAFLRVRQPGGVIGVQADYDSGKITALTIEGEVKITAEGIAHV